VGGVKAGEREPPKHGRIDSASTATSRPLAGWPGGRPTGRRRCPRRRRRNCSRGLTGARLLACAARAVAAAAIAAAAARRPPPPLPPPRGSTRRRPSATAPMARRAGGGSPAASCGRRRECQSRRFARRFFFFFFCAYVPPPPLPPFRLSAMSLRNVNESSELNASTSPQSKSYARSPRMRRESWMSFDMTVTRLPWMAHSWASWKRPTR